MLHYDKNRLRENNKQDKNRFFITIKGHMAIFYENEYEARKAFDEFTKNKVDVDIYYSPLISPLNLDDVPVPEEMTSLKEVNDLLGSEFSYIKPTADSWNTDYELFIRSLLLVRKEELVIEKTINEMVEFV